MSKFEEGWVSFEWARLAHLARYHERLAGVIRLVRRREKPAATGIDWVVNTQVDNGEPYEALLSYLPKEMLCLARTEMNGEASSRRGAHLMT